MTAALAIERHRTNPFATRHTRPGGVPPLDDDGRPRDLEGLLARLGSMPAAAIVGPHGTGKSTLLAEYSVRISSTFVVTLEIPVLISRSRQLTRISQPV